MRVEKLLLPAGFLFLAGVYVTGEAKGARIVYAPTVVTSGDPADRRYATPRGSGYDGVAELLVESLFGISGCTGVLLEDRRSLLTAAHCLTDTAGILLPNLLVNASFSWIGGAETLLGERVTIHPAWSGDVRQGDDLAIIHVTGLVSSSVQAYTMFGGTGELNSDFGLAAFGAGGTGIAGHTTPLGTRRRGRNTFDATMTGTFDTFPGWTGGERVLMADFDSGAAANDGFDVFFGRNHLGLGLDEASTAPGDSGGPAFVAGRIAGLSSFGARVSFADGSGSDIDDTLNSSFGEFNGYTRVSRYVPWIELETAIPEPSAAVLACGALLALVLVRRFAKGAAS